MNKKSRNRVDNLMAARKAACDFQLLLRVTGQRLPKSSLDGSRESGIPERYCPPSLRNADDQQRRMAFNVNSHPTDAVPATAMITEGQATPAIGHELRYNNRARRHSRSGTILLTVVPQ